MSNARQLHGSDMITARACQDRRLTQMHAWCDKQETSEAFVEDKERTRPRNRSGGAWECEREED